VFLAALRSESPLSACRPVRAREHCVRSCLALTGRRYFSFLLSQGGGEYASVGRLVPKRKISIILPDNLVQKAIKVIIETNQTGKSGDGKIFVLPVFETYRIRDALTGNDVLDF
jgi:nitrogen regulatory protein PII